MMETQQTEKQMAEATLLNATATWYKEKKINLEKKPQNPSFSKSWVPNLKAAAADFLAKYIYFFQRLEWTKIELLTWISLYNSIQ